jgi:hypothetical protein
MGYYLNLLCLFFLANHSQLLAASDELIQADSYFDMRDNYDNISHAKRIYENIIKNSKNNQERIHAFDRYARLAILKGQMAPFIWGQAAKNPSSIFEDCIKISSNFSQEKLGYEIPEYIYWRATCIGLWADNSSGFTVTRKYDLIAEMIGLIKSGEQKYPEYDNRAFLLLRAGLDVRSQFLRLFNLYNPYHTIELVNKIHEIKFDNYTSYLLKAEALVALKRKTEARELLLRGISDLKRRLASPKEISPLLLLESQATLYMMTESAKNLNFANYSPRKK